MPKLIYIAGPYRGATINETVHNIQRAREAAEAVAKAGHYFFCPHLNSALVDGLMPDSFWLDMDLELLRRCDAIYMMHGWESSAGARKERVVAEGWGKEIILDLAELKL